MSPSATGKSKQQKKERKLEGVKKKEPVLPATSHLPQPQQKKILINIANAASLPVKSHQERVKDAACSAGSSPPPPPTSPPSPPQKAFFPEIRIDATGAPITPPPPLPPSVVRMGKAPTIFCPPLPLTFHSPYRTPPQQLFPPPPLPMRGWSTPYSNPTPKVYFNAPPLPPSFNRMPPPTSSYGALQSQSGYPSYAYQQGNFPPPSQQHWGPYHQR